MEFTKEEKENLVMAIELAIITAKSIKKNESVKEFNKLIEKIIN